MSFFIQAEDNMNCQLREITVTARDGRVTRLEQVYIRGSHIRFLIVPDMLKNAPMFKRIGAKANQGRGIGLGRGRNLSKFQDLLKVMVLKRTNVPCSAWTRYGRKRTRYATHGRWHPP
jgi:hypothetical protein